MKLLLQKFTKKSFDQYAINAYVLIICVVIWITFTANVTFFDQVSAVYAWESNFLFLISLVFVLVGLLCFLMGIVGFRYIIKPILIVALLLSSITAYFTDTYGTVYDATMLQNALQTDQKESKDLLNLVFLLRVFLLGIIPSFIVFKIKISYQKSIKKSILFRVLFIIASLCLVIIPIVINSKTYASFFREHKSLRYYTIPVTPIYSVGKLAKSEYKKITAPKELIYHNKDANKLNSNNRKPHLMILVVGETGRADHSNFNGYERITFPKLLTLKNNKERFYNFGNVIACGTSTAYSVPCMFSYLGHNNYDVDMAVYQENVLDTLDRVGVKLLWRDNNSSDKGVMERLKPYYQDYQTNALNKECNNIHNECRDSGMLVGLDDYIKNNRGQDILIVLHQMGNHGPAYYKRYNQEFEQFTPVCESNELAKCDHSQLLNGYDNALLATDDFLFRGIELLKSYDKDFETALLYLSDHGESLGENGIYLHGMPYNIAPIEQKHILAYLWLANNTPFDSVDERDELTHDNITPTLLTFFGVQNNSESNKKGFIK